MNVTIGKVMDENELRGTAELASLIWHECFVDIITTEQIDYMVEKFQSFPAMNAQVSGQGYSYYNVRADGELCGYFAVKPEPDERFFLSKLYLRSDRRGLGIASLMLGRVFEEGRKAGKSSVYLTVNKYNHHAIEVYKKTGFRITDSAVTDIGSGFVMDDYIMSYRL